MNHRKTSFIMNYNSSQNLLGAINHAYGMTGERAKQKAYDMLTDVEVVRQVIKVPTPKSIESKKELVRRGVEIWLSAFPTEGAQERHSEVVGFVSPEQDQETKSSDKSNDILSLEELRSLCDYHGISYSHLAKEKSLTVKLQEEGIL